MSHWADLTTEQRNRASEHIDELSTLEMLSLINSEDAQVPLAVESQLPAIAHAVELVSQALGSGGRLFYMGAGTSGRLGILDAAECPPTFNTAPDIIQGLIAGGPAAVFQSIEGAEDQSQAALRDLRNQNLSKVDVVMGIAASGVTPYVVGGLEYATTLSCPTIFLTCNPSRAARTVAHVVIAPEVGPEVITGSTRMKAGTATKIVLNMISTATMVKLGKTYGNLMVDLQPRNAKLKDRAVRIFMELTQLSQQQSTQRLASAQNDLKTALVMELCQVDLNTALDLLKKHRGVVKEAVLHMKMAS